MYLIQAKVDATAPDFPGQDVEWKAGQVKFVHESLIEYFKANPAAWTVVSDLDQVPVMGKKTLTGGIVIPHGSDQYSLANYGLQGIALIGSSTFAYDNDLSIPAYYAAGPVSNGLAMAGWPVRRIKNFSVAGSDRSDLARQFALAMDVRPSMLAVQPGSNDIANGDSALDVWGVLKPLVDAAVLQSCVVVLRSTHPRGLDQTKNIEMMKLRSIMADYARFNRRIRVIDAWSVIVDPSTGSAKTGYLKSDNTHLSNAGAFAEGIEWAKLFAELFGSTTGLPGDAGTAGTVAQRVINPGLMGTGGTKLTGVTGAVPDAVSVGRFSGSGTAVSSIVTSGGKNKIRITTTGNAGDIWEVKFNVVAESPTNVAQNIFVAIDYVTADGVGHQPKLEMSATGKCLQRDDVSAERKPLSGSDGKSQLMAIFSRPVVEDSIHLFIYQVANGSMVVDVSCPSCVPAFL